MNASWVFCLVFILSSVISDFNVANCNLFYKRLICFRFARRNLNQCMQTRIDVTLKKNLICLSGTEKCATVFSACSSKFFKLYFLKILKKLLMSLLYNFRFNIFGHKTLIPKASL